MRYFLPLCVIPFFVLFNVTSLRAAEIKGHVYDKATHEQSVGAYVVIKSLEKAAITGLDGSYYLKDLKPGTYLIHITCIGYDAIDTTVTIQENNQVIKMDVFQTQTSKELKQVEVRAKAEAGSEADANNKEKNADNIMNIMSAKAIQISPDITVADVMQRISGVSVETSNSGSEYAIIRGMDKRYNTTLVNGVKIPSPDNRDRYVPLDLFPAELLERLEVVKSLTPSMEADATGGSINMVMKNAPDKPLVEANVATGYSFVFENQDFEKFSTADVNKKSPAEILGPNVFAPVTDFPTGNLVTSKVNNPVNTLASLSLGNRFFNRKLGVVVSGSYQNVYSGYKSDVLVENVVSAPSKDVNTNNLPNFSDVEQRQYSTLSQRFGAMAKLDYKINDKNTLSLFGTRIQLNQYRVRNIIDSTPGGSSFNDTWVNMIGVKYKTETRSTLQDINNLTLQGVHEITDKFSADWSLVGSEAERQLPNDAEFDYSSQLTLVTNPTTKAQSYALGAPYFPYVTGQSDEWQRNTDKDMAIYLNLHYKINSSFLKLIDVGLLDREKHRDNYDNAYSLQQYTDSTGYQKYTSIQNSKFVWVPANSALGDAAGNAGIYTFSENLLAYYAQAHIIINDRLKILGGVRVETTQQSYVSSLPPTIAGQQASYNYTDILPSVQAKYDLTEKSGIRFSYYKSLYRPAYSDLIPYPDNSSNETYNTTGNPYLQHSVIQNGDIRYELFPKGLDEFMVGAFYKYIMNPIEYAVVPQTKTDLILEPGNFGNATNYGLEAVARKFFGTFGVSGNYTYTHSNINSTKVVYDGTYAQVSQPRPLQGQAANIGNISLLYRNKRQKIEAQLAFVYTGECINTVSYYKDLDVWQKPTLNLDFSAQKQIGKRFIVYVKLKNLLNTGTELFIKQPNTSYSAPAKLPFQESANYYTVERDYYYSSMLIGVRFKLD